MGKQMYIAVAMPVPNQMYSVRVCVCVCLYNSIRMECVWMCRCGCAGENWKRDNKLKREAFLDGGKRDYEPQQLIMYMGMGIYKYKIQLIIRILLHYRLFILKSASFDIRAFA